MGVSRLPSLSKIVALLERSHGPPPRPIPKNPFEWVLWENVAYLVDDEKRAAAFRDLKQRVGLDPQAIAAARPDDLQVIVRGMRPQDRALRLRECAELALGGGDLRQLLELPPAKAQAALRRFPGIGQPGAEKILMFCGALPVLALESNGLRVLLRIGFGRIAAEGYAAQYRSVREALAGKLPSGAKELARAHALLRRHGQETCKNTAPDCDDCNLSALCRFSQGRFSSGRP